MVVFICAMTPEERDDLWELLARTREVEVSPFFSRNVLRMARAQEQPRIGILAMLRREWQISAAAAAACLVLGGSLMKLGDRPLAPSALAQRIENPDDYEVIQELDRLLASEDNSAWLDPANLLF